jgi:hypothetical protein
MVQKCDVGASMRDAIKRVGDPLSFICDAFRWCLKWVRDLFSGNPHKRNLIKKSTSTAQGLETVPFVSHYLLPSGSFIEADLNVKKIDGLMSLHLVEEKNRNVVLAYWKSRDHFEKSGRILDASLSGASSRAQGILSQIFLAPKRWIDWVTPQNLWTVVLGVVAFFTTLLALRNDYSWLLGKPKVVIAAPDGSEDFLRYAPISIDYKITNTGSCNARIVTTERRVIGSNKKEVSPDAFETPKGLPEMADLEPNKSDVFHIIGRGLQPGFYDIQFRGKLTNGWLGKRSWQGLEHKIRVWVPYAIETHPDSVDPSPSKHTCRLAGAIRIGLAQENGVICHAVLPGKPGVRIESVTMYENLIADQQQLPEPPGDVADTVSTLRWTTKRVDKFKELPFTLGLVSNASQSKDEWLSIAGLVETRIDVK